MGDLLEQLSRVPTSQKVLLLFLAVTGIFCAFYFLAFKPTVDEINQLHTTINQQDTTLSLPQSNNNVVSLEEDIIRLCVQQTSFYEQLPPQAEVSDLLDSIYQRAQQVGLEIVVFNPNADEPGTQYSTMSVSMQIKGTYDQVSDFFFAISEQPRIINVSDLELTVLAQNDNSGVPPQLDATCLLRTFYTEGNSENGGDICQNIE